jgi:hypothetical protein
MPEPLLLHLQDAVRAQHAFLLVRLLPHSQ